MFIIPFQLQHHVGREDSLRAFGLDGSSDAHMDITNNFKELRIQNEPCSNKIYLRDATYAAMTDRYLLTVGCVNQHFCDVDFLHSNMFF